MGWLDEGWEENEGTDVRILCVVVVWTCAVFFLVRCVPGSIIDADDGDDRVRSIPAGTTGLASRTAGPFEDCYESTRSDRLGRFDNVP